MEERIREILAETLELSPEEITPEKRLVADLGLTSFDLADVLVQAEEELGVAVPREAWAEVVTVEDVDHIVRELMEA